MLLATSLSNVIQDILTANHEEIMKASGTSSADSADSTQSATLSAYDKLSMLLRAFTRFVLSLRGFLSRVPTQETLENRFIASTCIITDPQIVGTPAEEGVGRQGDSDDDSD